MSAHPRKYCSHRGDFWGCAGGDICGNQKSKIYHLPNCPGYAGMNHASIVPFPSEAEAQHAGYRKAKNCP